MKTSFIELENKERHLRSGLSVMLQILNLSLRSKNIVILPSCLQTFLSSPTFPSKNLKAPPPKKIPLSPPPCGIHNECLSLLLHSPRKDNVPVNQILSIYVARGIPYLRCYYVYLW